MQLLYIQRVYFKIFFFSDLDFSECLYNPNFSLCSEMMRKDASLKSLSVFKMLFPNTPAEMCKKVLRLQEHRILNDKQPNGKMVVFPCDKRHQSADLSCNLTVHRRWNSKIRILSNKIQSQFINFIIEVIKYFNVISTPFNYCNILQHFLIFYIICNDQSHSTSHVTELPQLLFITWFSQWIIIQNTLESLEECKSSKCFFFAWFPYSICLGILTLILIKFNW